MVTKKPLDQADEKRADPRSRPARSPYPARDEEPAHRPGQPGSAADNDRPELVPGRRAGPHPPYPPEKQ